ncbi:MAG: sugar phosphate isomerase/epimerase [Bacillota bacterium]
MKIGFNESTAKGCSSLSKDLDLCDKAGFDYIEIRLDMLRAYLAAHKAQELKDFFADHSIKPHAINALYTYKELFSPNDTAARRDALMEDFLLGCRTAKSVGAHEYIIVPPMSADPAVPYADTPENIKADCVRILRRLADIAGDYGVNLCFELVGTRKCSVRTIPFAVEIVEETGLANVGYAFDPCNIFGYGKLNNFSGMAEADVKKIFAVHINDYDDVPEEQLTPAARCFCGDGVIDLMNYLSVLKKMGYQGMVSIETFRPSHYAMKPEDVIAQAYATTHAVLAKAGCL